MVVLVCRALTRVLALVALPVLGLVAGAFAVAAVAPAGTVAGWARDTQLTGASQEVGTFLERTAPAGELVPLLGGAGAVLLGLLILIGTLVPARAREIRLEPDLRVRRRALRQALRDRVPAAQVKLRRRRVKVRLEGADPRAEERLRPLTEPFGLRTKLSTRKAEVS